MQIITAGRTGPNRSVRFGDDAPLDDRGRRDILALGATDEVEAVLACGPEPATLESARLLGAPIEQIADHALRTLDVGAWAGLTPEQVPPHELAAWFTDPSSAPHGGESVAGFVARVHAWRDRMLDDLAGRAVVVAMPVAQALLCVDAAEYFRAEVRPASVCRWPYASAEETDSSQRT
ncbi:histidine phosphatase family protein [Gordonia aurantiaca]|uniref:histidine phosphatase family protein n=1 Tax=Gordonia sp. B21 TaxID=3151852 RepID=UPI003263857E